jgi:predicted  nucleic acid-binding Zn-ribbon protein
MGKELIFLLLGMGAGAIIAFVGGYIMARSKADRRQAMYQVEIDELLQANEEMEQELRPLRKRFKELEATLNQEHVEKAQLLERMKHLGDLRRELEHERTINRQLNERIAELEQHVGKLEAQMAAEAESIERQLDQIEDIKRKLIREIQAMIKEGAHPAA